MSYHDHSYDWTQARIDLVKQLWNDGNSYSQIAGQLGVGVTRNMVCSKIHRLKLPKRRDTNPSGERPKTPRLKRAVRRNGAGYVRAEQAFEAEPEEIDLGSLQAIEAAPSPATFLGIALPDLKPHHCRYPRGDGATILFCGQPRRDDSSYCSECHRRCHSGFRKIELSDAERARRRVQAIKNNQARRAA